MDFFSDVWEGEVHLRGKHHIEVKSEYSPLSGEEKNEYKLDFFFFIPTPLQINAQTYDKASFYQDLSCLIRYRTPNFTLQELIDPENELSPLVRISQILGQETVSPKESEEILFEIKLFGNIIRSTLRDDVLSLMQRLDQQKQAADLSKLDKDISRYCAVVTSLRRRYTTFVNDLVGRKMSSPLPLYAKYLDEFCSHQVEKFATHLLKELSQRSSSEYLKTAEEDLYDLIAYEVGYRKERVYRSPVIHERTRQREYATYREGLLKKFVLDVLLLSTVRKESSSQYRHLIGSFAAGVAMFGYMLLFVWQGDVFVFNSMPFVFATVFLYILKDRLKEVLRDVTSYKRLRWISDFRTKIRTPDKRRSIGTLRETFRFVPRTELPEDVAKMRETAFHVEVPEVSRSEEVIHYQRQVLINGTAKGAGPRRYELNDIFRLNVAPFCERASDPYETIPHLDLGSGQVVEIKDPKVYHLNVILKKTYTAKQGVRKTQYNKFRLILTRDGIIRIERLDGRSKWLNFNCLRKGRALP